MKFNQSVHLCCFLVVLSSSFSLFLFFKNLSYHFKMFRSLFEISILLKHLNRILKQFNALLHLIHLDITNTSIRQKSSLTSKLSECFWYPSRFNIGIGKSLILLKYSFWPIWTNWWLSHNNPKRHQVFHLLKS